MITEGTVCIWQNQVGAWSYLNGTETTVLKGLHFADTYDFFTGIRKARLVYETDTPDKDNPEDKLYAGPFELREKSGPDDEEAMDMLETWREGPGRELRRFWLDEIGGPGRWVDG